MEYYTDSAKNAIDGDRSLTTLVGLLHWLNENPFIRQEIASNENPSKLKLSVRRDAFSTGIGMYRLNDDGEKLNISIVEKGGENANRLRKITELIQRFLTPRPGMSGKPFVRMDLWDKLTHLGFVVDYSSIAARIDKNKPMVLKSQHVDFFF